MACIEPGRQIFTDNPDCQEPSALKLWQGCALQLASGGSAGSSSTETPQGQHRWQLLLPSGGPSSSAASYARQEATLPTSPQTPSATAPQTIWRRVCGSGFTDGVVQSAAQSFAQSAAQSAAAAEAAAAAAEAAAAAAEAAAAAAAEAAAAAAEARDNECCKAQATFETLEVEETSESRLTL